MNDGKSWLDKIKVDFIQAPNTLAKIYLTLIVPNEVFKLVNNIP